MNNLFPANPKHGTIFQQQNGILYQYDITIKAWLKIASDNFKLSLATSTNNGAMSAADLSKLNKLVLPALSTTIVGTDCLKPFRSGHIAMRSGDDYIKVDGKAVLQNVDYRGDLVSQSVPYQIHQHTYGFNFGLDVANLMDELIRRNQLNLTGKKGDKGLTGDKGEPGLNGILTGPAGDRGSQGLAPDANLTVVPETFLAQAKAGLRQALVNARVSIDPIDETKYKLEFDKQTIGNEFTAASEFYIRQVDSTWVLAVIASDTTVETNRPNMNCGILGGGVDGRSNYDLYYLDVSPIIDAIHEKFLAEIDRLKAGYEEITTFWINIMSDLFDEQKDALSCALERCISMTKSASERKHMESIGATILGRGKMDLHGRNSNESVQMSSTRFLRNVGGADVCKSGPPFPLKPSAPGAAAAAASVEGEYSASIVTVDPLVNSVVNTASKIELPAGKYAAVIREATASIAGHHRANVKLSYVQGGQQKTTEFLDKGSFNDLVEAQSVYEGLSIEFEHDGGFVYFYLPSLLPREAAGSVVVEILPQVSDVVLTPAPVTLQATQSNPQTALISNQVSTPQPSNDNKSMADIISHPLDVSRLQWYENSWRERIGCGCIVNVAGIDYILIKRGVGNVEDCGGGESPSASYMEYFINTIGHPTIAYPTLDGKSFAPYGDGDVTFVYDKEFNDIVANKILSNEYHSSIGTPNNMRYLSFALTNVIIPVG